MINFLAQFAVWSLVGAVYLMIGMMVAFVVFYLAEHFIRHNCLSARQLWLIILLPVTAPVIVLYEMIKKFRAQFESDLESLAGED